MPHLTGNFLEIIGRQWKDINYVVIHEISMVSYEVLVMIKSRLRQLENIDEYIGGINVLLFGDLMQFPPIRQGEVQDIKFLSSLRDYCRVLICGDHSSL